MAEKAITWYNRLKEAINGQIKQNGRREITGAKLNSVLNQMVDALGKNMTFGGVVSPATVIDNTDDDPVFYLALEAGNYPYCGNIEVGQGQIAFLFRDANNIWHQASWNAPDENFTTEEKEKLQGLPTVEELREALGAKANAPESKPGSDNLASFDENGNLKDSGVSIPVPTEEEKEHVLSSGENGLEWVPKPADGDDAYGVYVKEYKEGHGGSTDGMLTRPQWLDSLKGEKGEKGEKGDAGKDGHNPNLGSYSDVEEAPTTGIQAGDYIIVLDKTVTPVTGTIYTWNGTQWENTGRDANDSEFATGEPVVLIEITETPNQKKNAIVSARGLADIYGQIIDNETYIKAVVDSNGRFLMGIKSNGDVVFGTGIPSQIKEETDKIGGKVDKEEGMSLINSLVAESKGVIEIDGILDMKIDKEGKVIQYTDTQGTVHIFSAKIYEQSDLSKETKALIKSLPIVAAGLDNVKISKDERVVNMLTSAHTDKVVEIEGNNVFDKLKPCISIIDDDTIDFQLPSSTGRNYAVPNQGGYFSLLLPLLLSLGDKHGKKLYAGLACEGHRVGLTSLLQMNDDYSELNENGRAVKWLHDNLGWNVLNHSMTAQLPQRTFYVDGIDSDLATTIRQNGVYEGNLYFSNTIVLDRQTGKWYEVNSDLSAWVERTPTKKYALPFYQDYLTKEWYFNRDFDFEYSWGEWCNRADELGLPYEKVIVHNGNTSSAYMAYAGRRYANFSVRTTGAHNYPPLAATVNRLSDVTASGATNPKNAAYEAKLRAEIDKCKNEHSWLVFMTHFNSSSHRNYYQESQIYPDGDSNYPNEWIIPLKWDEIQDVIGSNTHDYLTTPPSRLGISSWSDWHPAPGTQLKTFYDVLDYALGQGIDIVPPMDGWETHGNILNIGIDLMGQTFPYDGALETTPLTDAEQSFLTVGADGSIRFFSK